MKLIPGKWITLIVVISFSIPATAQISAGICEAVSPAVCYYVSPIGNDKNPGSFNLPWRTFTHAVSDRIQPGDVIYARGGTYTEISGIPYSQSILSFNRYSKFAGDPATPVTYKSYPGEIAILDAQFASNAIHIQGTARTGIIIENFEIKNSWIAGIKLEDGPSFITIRGNNIHGTDGAEGSNTAGIVANASNNITIEGNLIHGNYQQISPNNRNNANIFLFGRTAFFVIRNNEMYNSVQGIWYKHSGRQSSLFENNYLHNLRGSAFIIATDNITMKNNLIVDAKNAFIIHEEAGCDRCSRDNTIVHNTVIDSQSFGLNRGADQAGAIRTTIRDNIFFDSSNPPMWGPSIWTYGSDEDFSNNTPDVRSYNNLYYTNHLVFRYFSAGGQWGNLGGVYDLEQFQAMGYETNTLDIDPHFVNNSGLLQEITDFSLSPDSPAKGKASDTTDIGADINLVGIVNLQNIPNRNSVNDQNTTACNPY